MWGVLRNGLIVFLFFNLSYNVVSKGHWLGGAKTSHGWSQNPQTSKDSFYGISLSLFLSLPTHPISHILFSFCPSFLSCPSIQWQGVYKYLFPEIWTDVLQKAVLFTSYALTWSWAILFQLRTYCTWMVRQWAVIKCSWNRKKSIFNLNFNDLQ